MAQTQELSNAFLPSELTRAARAVLAVAALAVAATPQAQAAGVPGQGTWETTLQGRDLDGNFANGAEAYYDTDLNITWLADANYAQTSGYVAYGEMKWDAAQAWVAQLNINGTTGWRLPDVKPVNGNSFQYGYSHDGTTDYGYNITSTQSELAHLYHVTLGNKSYSDTSGNYQPDYSGLQSRGPFSNVRSDQYWSGVKDNNYSAWGFFFASGFQDIYGTTNDKNFAWAVRPGDVGTSIAGASFTNPLIPGSVTLEGPVQTFVFSTITLIPRQPGAPDGPPLFVDPVVSTGYEYNLGAGNSFQSVLLPTLGDADGFQIEAFINGAWVNVASLPDGGSFTFEQGVTRFRVVGIDPALGLDPANPQAFVTGLNFGATGAADLTMTPLIFNTSVPEPQTYALMLVGLAAMQVARKRQQR